MNNQNHSEQQEVLEAVQALAIHMDEKFATVYNEIGTIKSDIKSIRSTMVTKDYLDEKMSDLRGDLTVLMRKEDTKLKTLVEVLSKKGVITDSDRQQILSMEPFAQLSI